MSGALATVRSREVKPALASDLTRIVGHTDGQGNPTTQLDLGGRREFGIERGAGLPHYFDGAVLPKSTFGALAISFSLSTVNCGFSLKPKSMAVRLVGNCTTTVLYSCTALM